MQDKEFLSTTELAKLLGISRIAVFQKIKKGEIKAVKVGRNFIINKKDLGDIFGKALSPENKKIIDKAVSRTAKEYGETLKLLGDE